MCPKVLSYPILESLGTRTKIVENINYYYITLRYQCYELLWWYRVDSNGEETIALRVETMLNCLDMRLLNNITTNTFIVLVYYLIILLADVVFCIDLQS